MIHALVSGVYWPPGYYIMRDRIPFFLTILYIYRYRVDRLVRDYLGYYLALSTIVVTSIASFLHITGKDMTWFAGIKWSAPSPIQWGLMICGLYLLLLKRGIPSFESFYLAFITAMAGGWLYEFVPLLFHRFNWFVFFKINAVKVFFVEFQVLCLPILGYIIIKTKEYQHNRLLLPVGILAGFFYAVKPIVEHYVRLYLFYNYNWIIRIPAIIFLYVLVDGIKGEKNES